MSQNKAFSTPFILAVLCIYFSGNDSNL
ncbi:hypothetical protein, partial [Escherichia coli]